MKKRVNRTNKGLIGSYGLIQTEGVNNTHQQYVDAVSGCDVRNIDYLKDLDNTYSPPSAWRSLPTINVGDQKFAGVFAVYNTDGNFVALQVQGAYIVDWGDGTTGAFASNAIAYKQYTQTTFSGLTSDVYNGYKTLVVQITPQGGNNLTSLDLDVKHNQTSLTNYTNNWLNILMSAPNLTFLDAGSDNTADIQSRMLEQFIFIGTNNVTSNDGRGMFASATNLKKVFIDTSNFTTTYRMFYQCYNLRTIPVFNLSKCTSMQDMFNTCYSLKTLPWIDTSNVTNFQGLFQNCASLRSVPPWNTSKGTNFNGFLLGCSSVTYVPNLDFSRATDLTRLFSACSNLRIAPRVNAPNATGVWGMFQGCRNLVKIPQLVVSGSATDHQVMFNECHNLEEVPFFNTSSSTRFAGMFSGCVKLRKIPNYNTSNVTDFSTAFQTCVSLMEFPRLDYSKGTNFGSAFNSCSVMKGGTNFGLTLSSGITLSTMFNACTNLQYLPPINLGNARSPNGLFANCISLKGITITGLCGATSGLNTSAFVNMFAECRSLQSLSATMDLSGYTGAAYVNVYSGVFLNCFSIEKIEGITGWQHSFSVLNGHMGATALNNIYSSLAVVGASGAGSKTITVTGNWGVTNDNPAIATSKGWTVTG